MSTVIIPGYGNVGARRSLVREIGTGIGLGWIDFIRIGPMVMASTLHGHMTVRPETQHKGRNIAMAQTEMA